MAFIHFTVFIHRVIFQAVFHVQITFLGKSLYMGSRSDLITGFVSSNKAMYKTRNTGTMNGMRGTRGMGGMLYSGECRPTFRGMLLNIPGNVLKHSGECHKAFRGTSPNIPGNVTKYSGECHKTFWRMSSKIPGNVAKHSRECCQFLV